MSFKNPCWFNGSLAWNGIPRKAFSVSVFLDYSFEYDIIQKNHSIEKDTDADA